MAEVDIAYQLGAPGEAEFAVRRIGPLGRSDERGESHHRDDEKSFYHSY
jgi:hypothetical protein